jgi:hypothetical protein
MTRELFYLIQILYNEKQGPTVVDGRGEKKKAKKKCEVQ